MKKYCSIGFLILVFLCSCGKNGGEKKKSHVNVVTLAVTSEIRSLDPRISVYSPSVHLIRMLYEGLMRLGPNGEILPGMAESVTLSEDQKTYTFQLRKAYWSNGDLVTAYDFEHAWKKSVNPSSMKAGAFQFYVIKNVIPCIEKKVSVDEVGIWALDAHTLKVELDHPAPYFLSVCTFPSYSPIHKGFDLSDPDWANDRGPHFVTNGPFTLKEWKRGVEVCVKKNPNYWNQEPVKLDEIRIQLLPDAYNQYLLFQKGKLDWVGSPFSALPPDLLANAFKKGELEVTDACGFTWLTLNTEKEPFNNKNFRKAIAYAIDRKSLVTHIFQLGEKPAMGILNGDIAVSDRPYFEDGNVERAKKHLSLALEEIGKTLQEIGPITLSQRDCPFVSRFTQAIQEQLRSNLGIQVEIERADWPIHLNRLSKGEYQIGEVGWVSWLKDPIYNLDVFRNQCPGINFSRWVHPIYQEILKKSDHEIDPKKRKEDLYQAEAFLMEEMPLIPICFNTLHFLRNKRLKGVYLSPLKEIDFRYAYFEPDHS